MMDFQALKSRVFFIALGLLTLLGAWLRWQGLLDRPLWGDEIYTLAHATGQLADNWLKPSDVLAPAMMYQEAMQTLPDKPSLLEGIKRTVEVLKLNNHPPLFFSMMGFWLQTAGLSILTLRLPAYLFGVASVALVGLLGRAMAGGPMGLLAAALWALSGYQVFQAQNARPYTWVMCLVLIVAWAWWQLDFGKGRYRQLWWPLVVGGTILALHSHYFSAPLLLALWGLGLAYWTGRKSRSLWIAVGITIVGALPLVHLLTQQWVYLSNESHFTAGLWPVLQLPEVIYRMVNDQLIPKSDLSKWLLLGVFLAITVDWVRQHRDQWLNKLKQSHPMLVWLSVWLVAVFGFQLLLDVVTQSNTISVRRYTFLASPAYAFLVVLAIRYGLAHFTTSLKTTRALAIQLATWSALFVIVGLNGWQVAHQATFANPDVRLAARAVGPDSVEQHTPVLVWPGDIRLLSLAWYLPPEAPVAALTEGRFSDKAVLESANRQPKLWVVFIKPNDHIKERYAKVIHHTGWALKPLPKDAIPAADREDIEVWFVTRATSGKPTKK